MASISNNEIKKVKSLSQKKFRDELGLFIVEGDKMVDEALHSDMTVEHIYKTEDIGSDAMARISALASPSPSLALVRKPTDIYLEDLSQLDGIFSKGGLYLALDTILFHLLPPFLVLKNDSQQHHQHSTAWSHPYAVPSCQAS